MVGKAGYKTTEIGTIPSDWNVSELKNEYEICNNLRFPISEQVRKGMKGKYPYYGPTGVQDYLNVYRLEGEYALIGEDGDHFLKWKQSGMTLLVNGKFNVNNHAHVLLGVNNDIRWFYWYFNHRDITPLLSRQGAGRYKLNKRTLEVIKMAIPPIAEQREIVHTLSDVNTLIELLTDLINKKKNIKLGTLQALITGKKRISGFREKWVCVKLGDISSMSSGGTPSTKHNEYYNGTIKWVSISDMSSSDKYLKVTSKCITQMGFDNCAAMMFPPNTILYAMYASIGECCISTDDCCTSQAILGIRVNEKNSTEFIYYLLKYLKNALKTQGQQGTQANLNKDIVSKIDLMVPSSIEEQSAIVTILSEMDFEIEILNQKLRKYTDIKQGMMQELLTGRIRLLGEVAQ